MKLYPASGKSCWDPAKGDLLPAEGRDVVDSTFWRRRLRDGDVTLTAPVVATVSAEVATATTAADATAATDTTSTDSGTTAAAAADADASTAAEAST